METPRQQKGGLFRQETMPLIGNRGKGQANRRGVMVIPGKGEAVHGEGLTRPTSSNLKGLGRKRGDRKKL